MKVFTGHEMRMTDRRTGEKNRAIVPKSKIDLLFLETIKILNVKIFQVYDPL